MAVPVITSAATASAVRFAEFEYQITATNAPTSYAATDLPAGLSVDTGTGLISGTPTAVAGSYVFTVTATNGDGTSAPLEVTLTLADPLRLFKGYFQGWQENDYLRAIVCLLSQIAGGSGGPSSTPAVPGNVVGTGTTPVVIPAGLNSFAISINGGNVSISGAGTEFTSPMGAGSYGWTAPSPGQVFPELTFTGDASADYIINYVHS